MLRLWLSANCRFASSSDDLPVTASIAAFREKKGVTEVLVAKRGKSPAKGAWALPGGHATKGESIQAAAEREMGEETSLRLDEMVYVGRTYRYKGETGAKRKIDTIFCGMASNPKDAEASSDVEKVKWVPIDDLPPLAFEHEKAIKKSISVMRTPPGERGLLVVFEGTDGSGKSTQAGILARSLEDDGIVVATTKWNSSRLLSGAIREAKSKRQLTPMLYSLLHASDMLHRYEYLVMPALHRNEVVICDRYYHTSLVRDKIRGIDSGLIRMIYGEMRQPDALFHCVVPPDTAVSRMLSEKKLTYYNSGMDAKLGDNPEDSCLKYTQLMDESYGDVLRRSGGDYVRLDTSSPPDEVAKVVMNKFLSLL